MPARRPVAGVGGGIETGTDGGVALDDGGDEAGAGRRPGCTRPPFSTERKTAPSVMPAALSHAWMASTAWASRHRLRDASRAILARLRGFACLQRYFRADGER